jgi:hypothetical protein
MLCIGRFSFLGFLLCKTWNRNGPTLLPHQRHGHSFRIRTTCIVYQPSLPSCSLKVNMKIAIGAVFTSKENRTVNDVATIPSFFHRIFVICDGDLNVAAILHTSLGDVTKKRHIILITSDNRTFSIVKGVHEAVHRVSSLLATDYVYSDSFRKSSDVFDSFVLCVYGMMRMLFSSPSIISINANDSSS